MRLKLSSEMQFPATSSMPRRSFLVRENSRQHLRKEVSLPATLVMGLDEVHGEIVDLSVGGALLLLPELPDPTRTFRLIIDLPNENPLILTTEIVRFDIRPADDRAPHLYGVAVRFINISESDCFALLGALC
jgi:hypothetical protein